MFIEINKEFFEKHTEKIPETIKESVAGTYRYGDTVNLYYNAVPIDDLRKLYDIAKEEKNRSLMMNISSFLNLVDNKESKVANIKAFGSALELFLSEDKLKGWIFKSEDNYLIPYLVISVKYIAPQERNDNPAQVILTYAANSRDGKGVQKSTTTFYSEDVVGKTVENALNLKNIFKENQEYLDEYESYLPKYVDFRKKIHEQFLYTGKAYKDGDRYWSSEEVQLVNSKCVNDEDLIKRKIYQNYESALFNGVCELPINPFIYMFSFVTHNNFYAHVSKLTEYVYDDTLRDKLILPEEHKDLIDVLVQHMDILMDDIIEGKSGGTTILCCGAPGLGKTLSAEVYSEIMHKPLYKVNSGQLGTHASDVEKNLETILARAQRWQAVLLLDEADTYIRKRENDIDQNAIVAAFLRTLEYFDGLLFMTTNRENDVDDAIVSRCIATIKYSIPNEDDSTKIWKVLSSQFGEELSDEFCRECAKTFKEISGRDIKELLKLSLRFVKAKGESLSIDSIRKCAQFRGI